MTSVWLLVTFFMLCISGDTAVRAMRSRAALQGPSQQGVAWQRAARQSAARRRAARHETARLRAGRQKLPSFLENYDFTVSREDVVDQARVLIVGLNEGMRIIKEEFLDKHYKGPGLVALQEFQNNAMDRERLFQDTVLEHPIADQFKDIGSTIANDYKLLFRVDYTLRELKNCLSYLQAHYGRFAQVHKKLVQSMDRRSMEVRFVLKLLMEFTTLQHLPLDFGIPPDVKTRTAPKYLNHFEVDITSYFILDDIKTIMNFIIGSFSILPSLS